MIQLYSKLWNLLGKEAMQDMMVETPSNLTSLSTPNFLHKLVWVKSVANFYYMVSGTGSLLSNWQPYSAGSTSIIVPDYNGSSTYVRGNMVIYKSILYLASTTIGVNNYPNVSTAWIAVGPGASSGRDGRGKEFVLDPLLNPGQTSTVITRSLTVDEDSHYTIVHNLNYRRINVIAYVNDINVSLQYEVIDQNTIKISTLGTMLFAPVIVYIVPIGVVTNTPPVVTLDEEQTVPTTAASNMSFTLTADAFDEDMDAMTYLWSSVSGPSTFTLTNTTTKILTLSGNGAIGTYVYRFRATDSKGAYNEKTIEFTLS